MRTRIFQSGKFFLSMVMVMATALAIPSVAGASIITVPNFSFEFNNALDNNTASATIWTGTGTGGSVFDPDHTAFAGTDGDNVQGVLPDGGQDGLITTYFSGVLGGSYTQTLVDTVAADTHYTLTVAVGKRLDITSGGWTIELLAGANVIASLTGDGTGITPGTFVDKSAVSPSTGDGSDPNVGQPLVIKIIGFNVLGNTDTAQDQFDDVRLSSAVPEPASALLLAGGALLLLRRRSASQL